eukprot:gb/GEZN01003430.1/.p1 GENE.gb/GEZN01003430.1/~~gb/GEZN01003430.1/.p1  ORF type:complete len:490 (+),score=76.94 gb/GEZN01003430.1/:337-1806(+)
MQLFILVPLIALGILSVRYLVWRLSVVFNKQLPPGTLGLFPVIGETPEYMASRMFILKLFKKHNSRMATTHILLDPAIVVSGKQHLSWFFSSSNDALDVGWPNHWQKLLGKHSLSVMAGSAHLQSKKVLKQAFTPAVLATFVPEITHITTKFLDTLAAKGERFEIYKATKDWAMDVAVAVLMGQGVQLDKDKLQRAFFTWLDAFMAFCPVALPGTALGRGMQARQVILDICGDIITQKRAARKQGKDAGLQDVLSFLLDFTKDDGSPLSDAELKDQCLVQLFAGHDTTNATSSVLFYYLSTRPDVLSQLKAEVEQVGDVQIGLQELRQMPYMDAILQEALRLHAPVALCSRMLTRPVTLEQYHVPKEFRLHCSINAAHLSEENYVRPMEFLPERWLPRSKPSVDDSKPHQRHSEPENELQPPKCPYSFLAFGKGKRMCLGMELARLELKLLLVAFVRGSYQLQMEPSSVKWVDFPFHTVNFGAKLNKLV